MTTRCLARVCDAFIRAHLPRRGRRCRANVAPWVPGSQLEPATELVGDPGGHVQSDTLTGRARAAEAPVEDAIAVLDRDARPWSATVIVTPWPTVLATDTVTGSDPVHGGVVDQHVDHLGDVVSPAQRAQSLGSQTTARPRARCASTI